MVSASQPRRYTTAAPALSECSSQLHRMQKALGITTRLPQAGSSWGTQQQQRQVPPPLVHPGPGMLLGCAPASHWHWAHRSGCTYQYLVQPCGGLQWTRRSSGCAAPVMEIHHNMHKKLQRRICTQEYAQEKTLVLLLLNCFYCIVLPQGLQCCCCYMSTAAAHAMQVVPAQPTGSPPSCSKYLPVEAAATQSTPPESHEHPGQPVTTYT